MLPFCVKLKMWFSILNDGSVVRMMPSPPSRRPLHIALVTQYFFRPRGAPWLFLSCMHLAFVSLGMCLHFLFRFEAGCEKVVVVVVVVCVSWGKEGVE